MALSEQDKIAFLSEAMGEVGVTLPIEIDWFFFGKLWEFCQEQEWWNAFWAEPYGKVLTLPKESVFAPFINPDRFANAVYEYLKDRRTP